MSPPLFWILFNAFVLGMLAVDLWIFHKPAHAVKFREALGWSIAWILMAAAFALLVYFWRGRESAVEFTAGYIIELSLSVDNLFIFLLIFKFFCVPSDFQHKVLFWGILGALAMRAAFIVVGIGLIQRFHWVTYILGAFLVYSGVRLLKQDDASIEPEKNPVLRMLRRILPVTEDFVGDKFFVRSPGLFATPLFVVLIIVETTDLLFATDSIPAILAITLKAFIVYTSNVFALLGLRSMYFVLAGMMNMFHYLHYGLSAVLIFIGAKMLTAQFYPLPTVVALGVVAAMLLISVLASVMYPKAAD